MKFFTCILLFTLTYNSSFAQQIKEGFEIMSPEEKAALSLPWISNDPSLSAVRDSVVVHAGKYSLKATSDRRYVGILNREWTIQNEDVSQFQLQGWIKKDSMMHTASLEISVFDGRQELMYYGKSFNYHEQRLDWSAIDLPFIVGKGVNRIRISVVLYGKGTVWVDDLAVLKKDFTLAPPATIEARKYVDRFLKIVNEHALNVDSAKANNLDPIVRKLTAHAQTTKDCYAAITYGTRLLGDHHTHFRFPEKARTNTGGKERPMSFQYATGKMIGRMAYVTIPWFPLIAATESTLYADSIQSIFKILDVHNPEGWIVDLRQNAGGNCWPMIAGLAPLLGDGTLGYFYSKNKFREPIKAKNHVKVKMRYQLKSRNEPGVAVLLSETTASSGEVVAIAFKGRPQTKFFGTKTAGLTTGNSLFNFPDGALLALTVSIDADRFKNLYYSGVLPDVEVDTNVDALDKAIEWLEKN